MKDFSLLENVKTGSVAHPPSYSMVPGFFPDSKTDVACKLTTHLHIVPRLRMSGTLPQLPLHAFLDRQNFTIYLLIYIITSTTKDY